MTCVLGLVAMHLWESDSPENLAEAGRWLQKADAILGEQKSANHLLLTGVLEGLKGNALLSQVYLRQAQELDPGNSFIKSALEAVNP